MTFDFLLDLIFYRNFDRIVFLQKLSLKLFLRCDELSFCMYSSIVFFNQILEFFAQLQCKNCTLSDVNLRLFSVSFENSDSFFIDCSNDIGAEEEQGVADCIVRISSSSFCYHSVFATFI